MTRSPSKVSPPRKPKKLPSSAQPALVARRGLIPIKMEKKRVHNPKPPRQPAEEHSVPNTSRTSRSGKQAR